MHGRRGTEIISEETSVLPVDLRTGAAIAASRACETLQNHAERIRQPAQRLTTGPDKSVDRNRLSNDPTFDRAALSARINNHQIGNHLRNRP